MTVAAANPTKYRKNPVPLPVQMVILVIKFCDCVHGGLYGRGKGYVDIKFGYTVAARQMAEHSRDIVQRLFRDHTGHPV